MGYTKVRVIRRFPFYKFTEDEVDVKARIKLNLLLKNEHYKTLADDILNRFDTYEEQKEDEYKSYLFDKYGVTVNFNKIKEHLQHDRVQ